MERPAPAGRAGPWADSSKRRRPLLQPALFLLLLAPVPASAIAQADSSVIPLLLSQPASVRSAALNGAGAALVGDAGAVFTNPAGLATLANVALEGAYRTAPGQGSVASGALAIRLRQFDLGVGVQRFDFGPDPTTYLGSAGAAPAASELLAVGSLVYRFGLIALGGSVKRVRRRVGTADSRAYSADGGLAIAFFDIMALAFVVQNIGDNWEPNSPLTLPRLTRFGFTMNYVDPQEEFRLLSTLEVQWPEAEGSRLVLGGEAGIVLGGVGLIGRVAWASRPLAPGRSQGTFGATLAFARLNIDYAYQQTDVLDRSAHRLGARLTL